MRKNSLAVWQQQMIASPYYKWLVLTVVQFGIILVGIGATSVNMAIPTISNTFHVPISFAQWIIVIYATTMAIALPIGGKLPQYLGRKHVVMGGFMLFSISSILCALATNIYLLLCYQVLLGLGSAALLANSNVITYLVFPKRQHGLAMGVNGTVASIGYGLGMLLGGYLVNNYGWSAIFWLNLPFGVAASLLSAIVLCEEKISESETRPTSFDFFGALFFAIFIACLMLSLSSELHAHERILPITISFFALVYFVHQESRAKVPLLDLNLFRIRTFSFGALLRLLITIIYSSTLFYLPIYTQDYLHMTATQSGIAMAPLSVALFFLGPIGGLLSDHLGSRWVTATGFLACAVALLLLGSLHTGSIYKIHIGMFLIGAGMGLFVPPNNSTTLSSIPAVHIGFVSGFLWSMAYVGTAVGTALSSLFLSLARHQMQGNDYAIAAGQAYTFHLLIPVAIVGFVLCVMHREKRTHTHAAG